MSTLSILFPLFLLWLAGVIAPGPNFFAVMHVAVNHGRRAALYAALGIATGTIFWACAGLFGLKIVFNLFPWAWVLVKVLGAAYLIYTGVAMWRTSPAKHIVLHSSLSGAFRVGLLANLANPKTAAFAASLFAVAIPEKSGLWINLMAFGLIVGTSWLWYSLCAIFASHNKVILGYQRYRLALTRIAGTLFIVFGIKLAFAKN